MYINWKASLWTVAFGLAACKSEPARENTTEPMPSSGAVGSTKLVKVSVAAHGFEPSSIAVSRGENVTLEFTRTTDKTCADKVLFPDIGITKDLPVDTPVAIRVPTDQSRKLTFQCGMGMYKSAVVVQ